MIADTLLPWLTELRLETGIFEHVWPRHDEGSSPEVRNSVVERKVSSFCTKISAEKMQDNISAQLAVQSQTQLHRILAAN